MSRRVFPLAFTVMLCACGHKTPTQPTSSTSTPPPVLSSVTVSAAATTIETGATTTVSAVGAYSDGTSHSVSVSWSSDATAVASVDANGTVHGIAAGAATIIGHASSGPQGTVLIHVIQAGPKTQFGAGTFRVNSDIVAGRYFSAPRSGCYWERKSGFGGSLDDIIANDFIGFNADQDIVDILSSDAGFGSESECGTWRNSPSIGSRSTITPGVWLVGSQIAPGTYVTNASSGCYWERLRNFEGTLDSIIANDFIASAGQQFITVRDGDIGVSSDGDCGVWTRSSAQNVGSRSTQSLESIRNNRERGRPRTMRPIR